MRPERRRLAGRFDALQQAGEALDRLERGEGGSLQYIGPGGVGKTTLLRAVEDLAVERGMTVATIQAAEWERALPWSTLSNLLAPFRRLIPALEPEAVRGLALQRSGRPAIGPDVEWFEVAMGALALLSHAADSTPVVVSVDDLHNADEASRVALASIVRRIQGERILVVTSTTTTRCEPILMGNTCTLDPLDAISARRVLEDAGVTDEIARRRIFAASNGVPATLIEIASKLTEAQRHGRAQLPDPLPAGEATEQWYAARVGDLTDREQTALLVAAADESGDIALVAAALEHLGDGISSLEAAEARGLIHVEPSRIRFDHPLARSVIYYGAAPPARRRVHTALAAVVSDGDRAVWHRARGVIGQDAPVADLVADLAERTTSTGALSTAADLFRQAATLSPDSGVRARRWLRSAELALAAGMSSRARADLAEVPDAIRRADSSLATRAATVEARLAVIDGDLARGLRIVGERLPRSLGDPTAGAAATDLAFAVIGPALQGGELGVARDVAAQVAGLLEDEETLSETTRAKATIARGIRNFLEGRHSEATEDLAAWQQLMIAAGPSTFAMLCETVATIYMFSARKPEATAMLDALETHARQASLPGGLIPVLVVRAAIDYGIDFPASVRSADEAITLAADCSQPGLARSAWQTLALTLSAQLDERRCRAATETILVTGCASKIAALAALGKLELSLGRFDAAVAVFDALAAEPASAHGPFLYHSDLAEALVRGGRPREAEASLAVLDAHAATGNLWALGQAHRVRALAADADVASSQFEFARQALQKTGNLYALALTELHWGEHLRRIRRRGHARPLLESARVGFERIGATGWLPRVDRELAAAVGAAPATTGADRSAVAALTRSELEIARRIAGGQATRDVARELFLSPRTIEAHLSIIYRKLDVRGRAGLATYARDDPTLR